MSFSKKWNFVVSVAIVSFMVKESHQCFSRDLERYHFILIDERQFHYQVCSCASDSKQNVQLKWVGPNNQEIKDSSGSEINPVFVTHEKTNVTLTIEGLSSTAGTYKCVAKQSDGSEDVISYEFKVHSPIQFSPSPISPQFVIRGLDSHINCSASGDDDDDQFFVSWYKDGKEIFDGNKYQRSENGLTIKNVNEQDEGKYLCSAALMSTGEYKSTNITVEVYIPPKVLSITSSGGDQVLQGEMVALTCKASGYPLPEYSWERVSNSIPNTSSIETRSWEQEANGMLVFKSITVDDDGEYECNATNIAGSSPMRKYIQVWAPPKITEFEPKTIVESTNVSIDCLATGRPIPNISIVCENAPIYQMLQTGTDNNLHSFVTLTFDHIDRHNSGECRCIANNPVDYAEKFITLEVLHKPYMTSSDEVVWVYGNKPVTLNCEHEAKPPGIVHWKYQGRPALTQTGPNITEWIELVGDIKEENLTLNEPNVHFYYGNYECLVLNDLGNAKKRFFVNRGFPPAKLRSSQINETDITATSITFEISNDSSIDAPPLLGYTAEYDEEGNYNVTDIHMNRTWALNVPVKIDKLKPGTAYVVRFAALNRAGPGPFGEYYFFTTPEKSVPESPILDIDALPDSPIRIPADNKVLKLKYPEDNGAPIDYYFIKYCRVDTEECLEEWVQETTELDLNHLSSNTSYYVEIVAHNSEGNSTSAFLHILLEADPFEEALLSAEIIIGIAVIVVIACIVIMDVLLFFTLKKGMIASCVLKKNRKETEDNKQSRDKKGLLKDTGDSADPPKRPDNGHKEFEYNKSTGIITGKHSAV